MKRAVVAIVNHDSYILLGKKIKKEKKFFSERWYIPGETLEDGETDEQGLIRGVKEEAGIDIIVGKYLATHHTITPTEVKWYECFAKTYDIKAGSDLTEVKWTPKNEVLKYIDYQIPLLPQKILNYFKK